MRQVKTRSGERGASTIEMTLVGIPLMFVLISIFEISRGMWTYHTMATAVREATRYAMVHGQNCVYTPPTITNNCAITVGNLATRLRDYGAGIICADGTYSCVQMELFPPPSASWCPGWCRGRSHRRGNDTWPRAA